MIKIWLLRNFLQDAPLKVTVVTLRRAYTAPLNMHLNLSIVPPAPDSRKTAEGDKIGPPPNKKGSKNCNHS